MTPPEALQTYKQFPLWRYQASGGRFTMSNLNSSRWRPTEVMQGPRAGVVGKEPEWLQTVLMAARLGGHITRPPNPPPDEILWFVTDNDGQLVTYLTIKDK